jgi:transposase-like protein
MNQTTAFDTGLPEQPIDAEVTSFREQFEGRELLDVVVRRGAQQILQQAIEAEVQEFLQQHQGRRDADGHRLVVRNGHQAARTIVTGAGALEVRQPRVRDNSPKGSERLQFTSAAWPGPK